MDLAKHDTAIAAPTARFPGALRKMFVWIFFFATGLVTLLGYFGM